MSQPPPRRRLGVEARREAILAAASRAFAAAPYASVSVARVAAEAGASEALVHKYFDGKAGLYTEVIRVAVDGLAERQRAADAELPAGAPARDRVRRSLEVYLEYIAASATGWAAPFRHAGNDPAAALALRHEVRAAYVQSLRDLLGVESWPRHEYAVWGYFGFLDGACLRWVEVGCPEAARGPLVDAALGALEGALGDWGR